MATSPTPPPPFVMLKRPEWYFVFSCFSQNIITTKYNFVKKNDNSDKQNHTTKKKDWFVSLPNKKKCYYAHFLGYAKCMPKTEKD